MRKLSPAIALIAPLLMASALTPVRAADMTFERALNADKEPQNWLLHHGNYQGHRFSPLKEINTDTVKNLKLVFTVALGGLQSGGRYAFGNLEATPIVEDGIMYVPDGWGSVYAIDVTSGKQGRDQVEVRPGHRPRLGRRRRLLRRQQSRRRAVEGQGDLDRARRPHVRHQQGDRREGLGAQDRRSGARRDASPWRRWSCATSRSSAPPAASSASAASSTRPTSTPASRRGGPTPSRAPASPATRPGRTARTTGSTAAARCGRPRPTIRRPTPSTRASAMPAPDWDPQYRPGDNKWAASVLALNPDDGKIKWGFQYTPNDPYDFDEISEHPIINAKVNGEDRKLVVHAARNGFFYALDRTNGAFVGRQAICRQAELDDGPRPQDRQAAQLRSQGRRPGLYARAATARAASRWPTSVRPISAARTGSRRPTIRRSTCSTSRRSKAATASRRWSRRTSPIRAAR